ncbi:BQ5605_C031g10988 [Microbotryum silenes-dioicae]|uniref:BQ5605_C031g10988 protein n=1 Tax=Microbotryum silenes-dioicae TaxID=796604 RepID=A0A2X0MHW7_9BASI|nr:BQ5605_C031g10988 [Microbotryum silenes-dioicae]
MEHTGSALRGRWPGDNSPLLTVMAEVAQAPGKPTQILRIPLSWLADSGTMKWAYLVDCLQMCLERPPEGRLFDEHGAQVDVQGPVAPTAEAYTLVSTDGQPFNLAAGPIGKNRFEIPSPTPPSPRSNNTDSDSSGSSSDGRTSFRRSLLARDGTCLITNKDTQGWIGAVHIIPITRQDGVVDVYDASCGILLGIMPHRHFACYGWSLYPLGNGEYIIHYFQPSSEEENWCHGKRIHRSHFRCPDERLPKVEYLRWHYKQCVLMHLRSIAIPE